MRRGGSANGIGKNRVGVGYSPGVFLLFNVNPPARTVPRSILPAHNPSQITSHSSNASWLMVYILNSFWLPTSRPTCASKAKPNVSVLCRGVEVVHGDARPEAANQRDHAREVMRYGNELRRGVRRRACAEDN